MNNVDNTSCHCVDEISLVDIWKKLVQYKKVFYLVFVIVFILGVSLVFLIPKKYNFSVVLEPAYFAGGDGKNVLPESVNDYDFLMKKVIFPKVVKEYNDSVIDDKKIHMKRADNIVIEGTNNIFVVSVNGRAGDAEKYKFILNTIVKHFLNYREDVIDKRLKDMKLLKAEIIKNGFGNTSSSNGLSRDSNLFGVSGKNFNSRVSLLEYFDMVIALTHDARAVSGIFVSELPVGPGNVILLMVVFLVSMFSGFFAVFVCNLIDSFKNSLRT